MPDTENDDLSAIIIDGVENPVGTASSTPDTLQTKRSAYPPWVLQERAGDEVDDGKRNRFRERLPDCLRRRRGYDDLIGPIGHRGRRALTASTPRTASPSR